MRGVCIVFRVCAWFVAQDIRFKDEPECAFFVVLEKGAELGGTDVLRAGNSRQKPAGFGTHFV